MPLLWNKVFAAISDGTKPRDTSFQTDLMAWGKFFLSHYFENEVSELHEFLAGMLTDIKSRRGSRQAIIAPRGNAKSTWSTLIDPLRNACEGIEVYQWIISDTADQALAQLEHIGAEVNDNDKLAEIYGNVITRAKVSKERILFGNGCLIEALGTGQKVRGRRRRAKRPTHIVVDDPENDEQVESPTQREKAFKWFMSALVKAGSPTTNIIVLGSALHRDSLLMKLTRTPGWQSHKFSSIMQWPTRLDLWAEWEDIYCGMETPDYIERAHGFYLEHHAQMHEGAHVLWSDREPLEKLMQKRASEGHTSFEREMQGNPVNPETCEWPETYFCDDAWLSKEEWPDFRAFQNRIAFLDPSKGKENSKGRTNRKSDPSAIVWIGTIDGILYIDADIMHRTCEQIAEDFVGICKRHGVDACGVETNAFQELLCVPIQAAAARVGFPLPLHEVEHYTIKKVRIRRLGPYFAQRRVRFRRGSPGCKILVDQLRDFPTGDHDDGPDALEGAIQVGLRLEQSAGFDEDEYIPH